MGEGGEPGLNGLGLAEGEEEKDMRGGAANGAIGLSYIVSCAASRIRRLLCRCCPGEYQRSGSIGAVLESTLGVCLATFPMKNTPHQATRRRIRMKSRPRLRSF